MQFEAFDYNDSVLDYSDVAEFDLSNKTDVFDDKCWAYVFSAREQGFTSIITAILPQLSEILSHKVDKESIKIAHEIMYHLIQSSENKKKLCVFHNIPS